MLILLAHGSRDPRWRASVEKLTDAVQTDLGQDRVRLAYLTCSPTLSDVVADAARAGVKKIRVLPLFLTGEGHLIRDVHPLVDQLRRAHGSVEVELLPPVGQHRLFQQLLCRIARQSAE